MTSCSGFTIVRNEELLIANHLIAMARYIDDLVCIIQPSRDATVLIATDVASQLQDFGKTIRVLEHHPDQLGKEYSIGFALTHCSHDWCFNLDADESYFGVPPAMILDKLDPLPDAIALPRWHAIAGNDKAWFKVEPYSYRIRLFNKTCLEDTSGFRLHDSLETAYRDKKTARLDRNSGRILEYKAPWQHYLDQLFYDSQGSAINERKQCEQRMEQADLELASFLFERQFR